MFEKEMKLYGKHAEIIKKYSKDKQGSEQQHFLVDNNNGEEKNIYVFETMIECYMNAAMIGIIDGKSSELVTGENKPATIFFDTVFSKKHLLQRIYQHMILSENSEESIDGTIKKAFSIDIENQSEKQERLDGYVRYGLEVIDSYFKNCHNYEDVAVAILNFVEKYGCLD